MPDDRRAIARALLSVSDKSGLVPLAEALHRMGVTLVSTGGTRAALLQARVPVVDVADVTGFPEIMDGRVKTLHPRVHGGLLARRSDPEHQAALLAHGIAAIDLAVINLYPFEETVAAGASAAAAIETIDVGGPAMIRAAAKNHGDVTVIVDPADYGALLAELAEGSGAVSSVFRRRMAAKAFARTAAYDAAIARWFASEADEPLPPLLAIAGRREAVLRYGENPHQQAGFYRTDEARPGVGSARLVSGKPLSYNNILDADGAFELVAEFPAEAAAAVAIIKHSNPCGVAVASTLAEAHALALRSDPVSAFGGVVAVNRPLDAAAAAAILAVFTEVIVAPAAEDEAVALVAAKPNVRLLLTGAMPDPAAPGLAIRSVAGGLLLQNRDAGTLAGAETRVVTRRAPSPAEMADLAFAWRVVKHVKSNAIVLARGGATAGVGAGQMSRVDSVEAAVRKAADAAARAGLPASLAQGAVMASDAFFPFPDGVEAAARAGVTAVIQPGGSVRDPEVIAAADAAGLAMVMTGLRHFRH